MNSNYTAIILAAGKGTRLRPLTDNIPKCMVEVADKPILEWQIDTMISCGIDNIIVVSGYREEEIIDLRVKKIYNRDYETTNMVYSLFCAREYLKRDVIVSYGDIVYSQNVLQKLMQSDKDMVIASDEEWLPYWKQRCEDPLSDAETFKKGTGRIVETLGQVPSLTEDIEGQFIGLMKFSEAGCLKLKQAYDQHMHHQSSENAWGSSRKLRNAYMTDILNHFACHERLYYVPIRREWFEVDNITDLEIANNKINTEFALNKG